MSNVRELSEWDDRVITDLTLTHADRQLASRLSLSHRLCVDELRDGIRFRSQSWVGLIRFDNFDIRIVPKLADAILG